MGHDRRAFVLLSGGIDSTTCLYLARNSGAYHSVEGVSIDYGQRHSKEIEHARRSCVYLGIKHHVLDLSPIVPRTMLTDDKQALPDASYANLPAGISPTYVPFRNGLMLSALATYVQGKWPLRQPAHENEEWAIYFGAHAEDAANWAYPDCTPEFIGAMANAIYVGSYRTIRLYTPLQWLDKRQIIELGERNHVNWKLTWSCYAGGDHHCGTCPTCRARRAGFSAANVTDPTTYAA
jgi:7-cyano-7-deazaguanine synthase